MATERPVTGNAPAVSSDDYQEIPKPTSRRVDPETRSPAACMIWSVVVGMALLVAIVLCWGATYIGNIDWGMIFK
jgi:hypothetical protein